MVAVSLKKKFFQAEDGIRDKQICLVGSEMCIRDRCYGETGVLLIIVVTGGLGAEKNWVLSIPFSGQARPPAAVTGRQCRP